MHPDTTDWDTKRRIHYRSVEGAGTACKKKDYVDDARPRKLL